MCCPTSVQALVQGYEAVAGRGAMIGLIVATSFELLIAEKDKGLFSNWQSSPNGEAEAFAFVAMALITLSAALAAASTRKLRNQMGQKLLEPVITSLTSGQRRYSCYFGVPRGYDAHCWLRHSATLHCTLFAVTALKLRPTYNWPPGLSGAVGAHRCV